MPSTCVVVGCKNRAQKDKVNFFRLPKQTHFRFSIITNELNKHRRTKWIEALKNVEWSENKLRYARVCSIHFRTGRPASLEDVQHVDWVPSLHLNENEKRKPVALEVKKVIRSGNFCTLCYLSISRREALEVCDRDGNFTQFGCILHHILKMSGCPFRSRFCCTKCSKTVMNCFSTITDINIQALVTKLRTGKNSISDILDEGCVKCGEVFPSVAQYSDHLTSHIFDSYVGLTATLDRQADMKDLKERKMLKDEKISSKPRKEPQSSDSDTESAASTDCEDAAMVTSPVVLQAVGDEHNYDKEREIKKENVEPPKKVKKKPGRGIKRKRGRRSKILSESANQSKPSRYSVSTHEFIRKKKRKETEEDETEELRRRDDAEDDDSPREKLDFPCKFCYFEFSHENFLEEHVKERHKTMQCVTCSCRFKDLETLEQHEKEKHSKMPVVPIQKEPTVEREQNPKKPEAEQSEFQCGLCVFGFSTEQILLNHIKAFHPKHKEPWHDLFKRVDPMEGVETSKRQLSDEKITKDDKRSDNEEEEEEETNSGYITEYLEDEGQEYEIEVNPERDERDEENMFECGYCNFRMPTEEIYAYHLKSAHKAKSTLFE